MMEPMNNSVSVGTINSRKLKIPQSQTKCNEGEGLNWLTSMKVSHLLLS